MSSQDALLEKLQKSESFKQIHNLFPNIDFNDDIYQNPELAEYIRQACVANAIQVEDPRKRTEAPKLDEDFSKYFVINNLPVCDAEKSKKLILLITKLYQKQNVIIEEKNISMPINEQGNTEGCAFVLASSEDQAKFAAALMNNYQFDKKHLLSACWINDFEKIMQSS